MCNSTTFTKLLEIKAQLKTLKAEEKIIVDKIKASHSVGTQIVGGFAVTINEIAKERFDVKTFKVDHPSIAKMYLKPSIEKRLDVKPVTVAA